MTIGSKMSDLDTFINVWKFLGVDYVTVGIATVTNKTDIVRFQRFAHHRRI